MLLGRTWHLMYLGVQLLQAARCHVCWVAETAVGASRRDCTLPGTLLPLTIKASWLSMLQICDMSTVLVSPYHVWKAICNHTLGKRTSLHQLTLLPALPYCPDHSAVLQPWPCHAC